ncbi:leucine-rich repeat-containing protein 24-like [Centruroides vittatus]|uniref:leucine-rich repeat-containing protein 24-like n=1 Tax=Centruroides vittatus TaxID=120091 RepID=UPI00350FC273
MSIFEVGSEMASINWIMSLGALLVLLISPADTSHSQCPSVCLCKWKSGKQTVECIDKSLTNIPSGIQNGVQVLDLRRNNLGGLPTRVFLQNGLTNLQKIYMPRCNIREIADDAFHQVTNLVELDLTANLLNEIPAQIFKDFPLLRRLQLGHNPIQRINNGTFVQLPHLTFLEFSNCEIHTIEPEAFKDLKNLEFLMLDNNKIKTLSVHVVKPLNKLYGLALQNNPWYCDCNLRGVREWMMENNIPINFPPKCDLPARIHGEIWNNLELDDFSCPPVIHCEEDVQVQRYQNGTLECQVESNPEAVISWTMNGVDINNGSVIFAWEEKYFLEEEEMEDEDTKNSRLIVIRVSEEDSGVYTCAATNSAGTTVANITLSVVLPPVPLIGWSNAQIAGFVVGILLFVILIVVLVCIVMIRRRVLRTSDSKLGGVGFLKHLAYVKQNSVEVKNDKEITANDKHLRRETGSSGYGSDQQTPDLVSRAMEIDGPSPQKPSNHVDSEETWNMNKLRSNELEWLNNRVGRYVPSSTHYVPNYMSEAEYIERTHAEPSDTGSFRDESYHSYTSPVHNNWKRSPLVLPNNAYLSLSHDMHCCSPDEGYDEGALEGTEV